MFAIQDEIAQAIAGALQVKLARTAADARHHTPRLAAYDAFLRRAPSPVLQVPPESSTRGVECLEQAIALDPEYAQPHAELGLAYLLVSQGHRPLREVVDRSATKPARRSSSIRRTPGRAFSWERLRLRTTTTGRRRANTFAPPWPLLR